MKFNEKKQREKEKKYQWNILHLIMPILTLKKNKLSVDFRFFLRVVI